MAAKLPDGSQLAIASAYAAAKSVTAITNAAAPSVSATGHGLLVGDFVEITSGWGEVNGRIFKVASSTTDAFTIAGIDTTDVTKFPVGSSAGSVRKISTWTQVMQVLMFETQGGEQQFVNFSFMEEDFERQLPSIMSAMSLRIGLADDPTLPGYIAMKAASDTRAMTGYKLALRDGGNILYNGITSVNETPTTSKGQVMIINATVALQGKAVRV